MKVEKLFTKNLTEDIFGAEFKKISVEIKSTEANSFFTTIEVEVPSFWSKQATDILVQRFFRKTDVPVITKKISENSIPQWLQKSEADMEELEKLPLNQRFTGEFSAKQVFTRLAGAWTYWGYKLDYFDSEESAKNFFDEICYILCHQIAAPHSPQWFNSGLHWAYGIKDEAQGHFYFDESMQMVRNATSAYERPHSHSCFIQGVEDNLLRKDGILDLVVKEARLSKYGSGSGTNFSNLRAKGEAISSGGVSSGLISFLKISDTTAGVINSGGIARLVPQRVILDADHPDIEEFVSWKLKEEQKVISLITGSKINHQVLQLILNICKEFEGSLEDKINIDKNSKLKSVLSIAKSLMIPEKFIRSVLLLAKQEIYTLDFDTFMIALGNESYNTVAGQNSTTTVSVSNLFLEKVLNDEKWDLINRVDGSTAKSINAKDLWRKINYSVWSCTEPNLQYDDTINQWHTCPVDGKIKGSNVHAEYLFLDDTACGLASINLMHFRNQDTTFNTNNFSYVVSLLTLALGICVSMSEYPSEKIAEFSNKFRPIGISYCNMSALLMSMGLAYDSEVGRNTAAAISSLLTSKAYETSSIIAKKKGSFDGYEKNASNMLRVLQNHRKVAYGKTEEYEGITIIPTPLNHSYINDKNLLNQVLSSWDKAIELGTEFGFRNAQVSSIALASSISVLMDCSTVGIEPEYALVKYKSQENGNYSKVINEEVLLALEVLKYNEEEILDISKYMTGYKTLKDAPAVNHESLKVKGFSEIELEKIENTLNNIANIEFAFNIPILGEDFCVNKLGIPIDNFKNPNFSVLQYLGFLKKDIIEANIYVTGSMGLEKARSLKKEHLSIFDCSVPNGARGVRALSLESHINMMTSIQPFISGGIAKTIILSKDSTIEDCSKAYIDLWQKGAKLANLFIEGSRLSQPVQNSILDSDKIKSVSLESILQELTTEN
ncbi:MAG: vitamin B12-dependent ribonucleotide reductase [Alphaproteobacteria bacterium]|jgi:ribonucleoside-diphosphate reductase alpha chain|nr:vitamin B12-dependent ribonucleotide reductase [Alphaproteobacteria bacterium]